MKSYHDSLSLCEGLSEYLKHYSLGDGGYTDRWFKINFFWKFTIILPNISNRVEAVKFHDLHHVLTEYETGLRGEAEIDAWEIASGCGKYWAALMLNMGSLTYGVFLFPKAVFKAFIRGRHNKNLYHDKEYERILDVTVGNMRAELNIGKSVPVANVNDTQAFILWCLIILLLVAVEAFVIVNIVKFILRII